jgi:hypothetical protein
MYEKQEENWSRVEESARKRAVKSLKDYLESEIDFEILQAWREQYEEDGHFGEPIMDYEIRDILRKEISENNLPWVEYPGGKSYRTWNDFYLAALREALGLEAA